MSFSSDKPLQSNQLPISVDIPEVDDKDFRSVLNLLYKRIANAVNTKEGALYSLQEVATFQQYFTAGDPQKLRPVYRTTVNFGALPNTGVKTVAHGIAFTSTFRLTHLYAAATDPNLLLYIPIPYASPTLANNIELSLDSTNVIITTGSNRSNFTDCTVVIEYLKY